MAKVIFDGAGEMPELNRITAKKNYASSSQAHKMGATAMFNDILHYLGKEKYPKLINEVGGQVAVRQHPVYAFQKIPIEGSEGQYNRKFIGLFTVGPDKGDKNYFGFTNSRIKDRAIRLEGTDHLKGVGFNYPWTVNGVDKIKYNHAEESLCIVTGGDKTKWTKIWEQSVCGDKETEAEIEAYLKELYKPAYEVAYYNNPLIVGVDMTLSEINSNIEAFGKRRRIKDDRQYSYCEFWIDGEYDIYYLDAQTNKYEKNGINLLSDLAITADEIAGMTIEEKNDLFISRRVARFKEEAKYYFCIDDAIYQLMFLFIIVASDNFEKNMYPYIMELLWRFFQDDLDSIFSTDNQAQNTKKYSAEIHDFTDDTKSAYVFKGEDSAFWQLIELAYPDECKQMGRDIFQAMYDLSPTGTTTMEKLMGFFDEYFFNRAQKYFTPSAYNNDTEYAYEEAWNNKEYVASVDIHPLAQALGSQESTERAFLEKRLIYLMSKFGFGGFNSATDTDLGIISVRTQDPQSFTLTPAIDLYPTVLGGQAQSAVATERVMAGQPVTLPAVGGGNTNVYIVGADWLSDIGDLKDLKVDPSSVVTLTISSKRLRRIKVGDKNADSVTSYLGSLSIQKCDSLETIDARNLQTLVGTVDLSNCPRLVEALFGGSNANAIIIAPGSKVEKLQFSDSITTIDLRNNTFLKDVEITNFAKIRFLRLENVPIINGFDVLRQAYNTAGQQLENIRIIGFTYTGGADDLLMLSNIAEGKDKDGNAHNYGAIDTNGDPIENTLPIIEGNLHIAESVNRTTYDFVQGAFHALALTADDIVDYVIFADPEVSRIIAQNWGDGIGTTLEQIEAITDIDSKFANNTLIETFDEFEKFTGVTKFPYIASAKNYFCNCSNLKKIKLPNSLTEIGGGSVAHKNGAFQDCTSLEVVEGMEQVTYIGDTVFRNCSSLKRMNLSKNLEHIGNYSFRECGNLYFEEINLPKLKDIPDGFGDAKIKRIVNLGEITSLPVSNMGGADTLENVVIPNTITVIPRNIFKNYQYLSDITIPSSVIEIQYGAFYGTAITRFDIDNLQILGGSYMNGALANCKNLKEVHLPESIISIGNMCFKDSNIDVITIKAKVPPTLGDDTALWDTNRCPIYVPDASVEAYKTATNWNAHASRIQSIFYYLGYIDFVDPAVRDICVANFDTDGDGVVSIEEAAAVTNIGTLFKGNTSIESFDEFKYFTGVTKITSAESFSRCSNMKSITLPESLTDLGAGTWWNCAFEHITIPKNVVGGFKPFANNAKLKTITVMGDTPISPQWYLNCPLFEGVVIPSGHTKYSEKNGSLYSLDGSVFYCYASNANMLDFYGVSTINDNSLYGAVLPPIVEIPTSVSSIGGNSFRESSGNSVVKNYSSANLGGETFYNAKIESLIMYSSTFVSIAHKNCIAGSFIVYVPDNLLNSYKSASGWSTYESRIKPLSEYVES